MIPTVIISTLTATMACHHQVKENSINVIFAVTAEQRETYDELSRHIEASSAGTLSNDSSNVVQLVKEQYDVSPSCGSSGPVWGGVPRLVWACWLFVV